MSEIVPNGPPQPEAVVRPPVPAAPTVAPGWYPDPNTPGMQRWWNGRGWGEQTAPLPPSVQQQPVAATTVVVNSKRPVNHVLHLILTVLTLGLWLPVWIIVAIAA